MMVIDPGFVAWAGYSTGAGLPVSPAFWRELSPEVRAAWRAAADAVLMHRDMQALNPPAAEPRDVHPFGGVKVDHLGWNGNPEDGPRIDRAEDRELGDLVEDEDGAPLPDHLQPADARIDRAEDERRGGEGDELQAEGIDGWHEDEAEREMYRLEDERRDSDEVRG